MRINSERQLNLEEKVTLVSNFPITQGRNELLSILNRANEIAVETDTIVLIQKMLDLLIEVTLAESAYFFRLDPETNELIITSVRGEAESQNLIGLRLNCQQILPGISIYGEQPVIIGDLTSEPYWLRSVDLEKAARKLNVINSPVSTGDCSFGIVQIFNFKQMDLDLLSLLSRHLATEIDHRIKIDATRQSNQRLWGLIEVLSEVAGTLDRNRLLHLVTEHATRLVDAERSSVFLVDPSTNEMVFQVAYRPLEQAASPSIALNLTNLFNAAQFNSSNSRQICNPQRVDHQPSEDFGFFNRSAITVPLRSDSLVKKTEIEEKHVMGGLMVIKKQNASFCKEDAQLMQILADQTSTFLQVAEMYESAGELFMGVIKSLAAAIDAKDPYTQGHSQRVSDYSVLISQELGIEESLINDIRIGSLLHDIGKIGIPDPILLKKEKLTPEEFAIIRGHPNTGVNILNQVKLLEPMLPAIAEHHERLDGSGYPLNTRKISMMGRIVAVADVFDAMTSNRPYRPALSVSEVLAYLQESSGTLFDLACVQALATILTKSNC